MARRGRQQETTTAPRDARVAGGHAELLPDSEQPGAWELRINGAPQSHVDPSDPTRLRFAYQRHLGHICDLAAPAGRPVTAVHLGGGAATLPRYLAATRPRSRQQVAEPDTALTEFVRAVLPLPRGGIRVRGSDARQLLTRLPEGAADLVISDVFDGARTPAHCATGEFVDAARRVLRPGGWYAANVTDGGALHFLRGQLATVRSRFAEVLVLAEPAVLRGRRFGNAVLLAADEPLPATELGRRVAADPCSARLLVDGALRELVGAAPVVTDATAAASPPPPPGTFD